MINNLGFKLTVGGLFATGCFLLGDAVYKKIKALFIESQEKERMQQEELNKDIEEYNKAINANKERYSEMVICQATLSNDNIKNKEDKSYAYDKLKQLRNKAIECPYSNRNDFINYLGDFEDLYNIFYNMDKDTIDAKILSMRNEDKILSDRIKNAKKEYDEEKKHRRELEIIEENTKKDVEVYKARISAEQAKLKTLCKAMEKADKSINSTLNIKTSISED